MTVDVRAGAEGGTLRPEIARAAEVLAAADEVTFACHVNPDADALGSMLGLAAFLRERGTRTVCGVQLSAGMKIEIECIALASK